MKKILKKTAQLVCRFRYAAALCAAAFFFGAMTMPCYASTTIGGSKLGTGLQKLINDLTTWLMVIAPIAMVVMLIYFFIRKGMADEMDQKKWNSRVMAAIVSCVGAFLAAVIVQLAQSYFG